MSPTAENIRLLSLFHYVLGSLTYLTALFPIFHLAAGIFLLLAPFEEWAEDPSNIPPNFESFESETAQPLGESEAGSADSRPSSSGSEVRPEDIWILRGMGGVFTGVAALFMLSGIVLATLMIIAGRRLSKHRSHTFCLIVAGLECMLFPFHSILGIFTFILLLQPDGRALFETPSSEPSAD